MSSEHKKQVARDKAREYRNLHPEECRKTRREYRAKNRNKLLGMAKKYRDHTRYLAIEHYSEGIFRCANCGYGIYEALAIDHLLNNGTEHRKEIKGVPLAEWLVKSNFPEGYQILCFNCNYLKFRHPDLYEQIGIDAIGREEYFNAKE